LKFPKESKPEKWCIVPAIAQMPTRPKKNGEKIWEIEDKY
jgi:hypothetical protein